MMAHLKLPRIVVAGSFFVISNFIICHLVLHKKKGADVPFFRSMPQLTEQDWSDLEKMKMTLQRSDSNFATKFDRSKDILSRRRLSSSTWDDEINEVREELKLRKGNKRRDMVQITGPGVFTCGKQASMCKVVTPDLCKIDFLELSSQKSWENTLPPYCTLKCPSSCMFLPSSKEVTTKNKNLLDQEPSQSQPHPYEPKQGDTDTGAATSKLNTSPVVPSKIMSTVSEVLKNRMDLANDVWVGPGAYYCPMDEISCTSMSPECKIDITDWTNMQYYSAYAETTDTGKQLVRRVPPGCQLSCPSSCSFMSSHDNTQTSSQDNKKPVGPRNNPERDCIDQSNTELPCPNISIWEKCDKYNGGDFKSCYDACKPSFCCIHDSKSVNISPSCSKRLTNCVLYSPCYIVWWYLQDSIGPLTFSSFQYRRQNEPFYNNAFDITEWISEINSNQDFFNQFYGHPFDSETRPTDAIITNPDFW